MQDFRRLRAWHLARDLAVLVSASLSASSSYRVPGLRVQLVRAAVSIPQNIAEGCASRSPAGFRRYLETSLGSLLELESGLEIALAGRIVSNSRYTDLVRKCAVLRRMLRSLIERVERRIVDAASAT